MANPIVVDLADPSPFNHNEWIGRGKRYIPENLPYNVINACTTAGELPAAQKATIPPPNFSVNDFLAKSFPPPSRALVAVKARHCFSNDRPDDNFAYLTSRPVPSSETLRELGKEFGQAWLDGAQSIVDPRYNDGRDRLPLWSLAWWQKMTTMVRSQSQWKQGEKWLTAESKTMESTKVMSEARDLLAVLPWNEDAGWSTTTLEFSRLLGTHWVSDTLMDMMMEHLAHRAQCQNSPENKSILIGTVLLSQSIEASARQNDYSPAHAPLLARYEMQITALDIRNLYLPVHVHGNHWVAVVVDFHNKTIQYGKYLCINGAHSVLIKSR